MSKHFIHPYIPNSVPETEAEMLKEVGVNSIEEIYHSVIPQELRFQGEMDIPAPILGEQALKRHVTGLLAQNRSTEDYVSFLGAGCYKRYVPAVCDEIGNRSEFLTAYCGDTYSDHGKMQAIFEYTSMMGELLDMDVVSYPTYDAGQAVCSALRMSLRLRPGRKQILVPDSMSPEILSQARTYIAQFGQIVPVITDQGVMDLADLKEKLNAETAVLFLENPSYLGAWEPRAAEITALAHEAGALAVVQCEPSSLGIAEPPSHYGADIACGDIQTLGIHMQFGSGCGGFIACADDPAIINEIPTYLYGIAETKNPGEYGYGRSLYYRCSHASREDAREYFGTESGLYAIIAASYLASLGPAGMAELGTRILQLTAYAVRRLSQIPGLFLDPNKSYFQEFPVRLESATVASVNQSLLKRSILGGLDLSKHFPALGQSMLVAISDTTTKADIDKFADSLEEILGGEQ